MELRDAFIAISDCRATLAKYTNSRINEITVEQQEILEHVNKCLHDAMMTVANNYDILVEE